MGQLAHEIRQIDTDENKFCKLEILVFGRTKCYGSNIS